MYARGQSGGGAEEMKLPEWLGVWAPLIGLVLIGFLIYFVR